METLDVILRTITYFLVLILVYLFYLSTRKRIEALEKVVQHLFHLTDALHAGITAPVPKGYYEDIRKMGPFSETSRIKRNQILDSVLSREFEQIKANIEESIKNSSDPVEISKMEMVLSEMENIYTLAGTIGPETSEEYRKAVHNDIEIAKNKILRLDQ